MITGSQTRFMEWDLLQDRIKQCLQYAERNDLKEKDPGSYDIDGENCYVNIVEYETVCEKERFWEAHKKYLDLHLMLKGTERIDLALTDRMEKKEYVPEQDFLPLEGDADVRIYLREGDFLICGPDDGHRTGVLVDQSTKIKKAIFKILIVQ